MTILVSQRPPKRQGVLFDELLDSDGKPKSKFGSNLDFPNIAGVEVDMKNGVVKKFEKKNPMQIAPAPKDSDWDKDDSLDKLQPVLNWRIPGNYEPTDLPVRTGPGEYGVPVSHTSQEQPAVDAAIKEFGFNMVNSDKISLDRYPKDLRHQE